MKKTKLGNIFEKRDSQTMEPSIVDSVGGDYQTIDTFFPGDDSTSTYQSPTQEQFMTPQSLPQKERKDNHNKPVVDEIPLLVELGIDFRFVLSKSFSVLNPFSSARRKLRAFIQSSDTDMVQETPFMQDEDLVGPVFFALLLGTALLFKGEIHYSSIYGCGGIGCFLIWLMFNLMAEKGVWLSVLKTVSVLGYGLLPIVFLAFLETGLYWILGNEGSWRGILKAISSLLIVIWSTSSATEMFVANLKMKNKYLLVAYPTGLLFSVFIVLVL